VSFYTFAECFQDVGNMSQVRGGIDCTAISQEIDAVVADFGLHKHVAADVKQLLSRGEADFKLVSWCVIELMPKIAALMPNVSFMVRGRGEDPRMLWLREYEHGRVAYELGPPKEAEA
jgi:hypothetical protein